MNDLLHYNVDWKHPVESEDDLPLEGNEVGDARLWMSDPSILFVWLGDRWAKVMLYAVMEP